VKSCQFYFRKLKKLDRFKDKQKMRFAIRNFQAWVAYHVRHEGGVAAPTDLGFVDDWGRFDESVFGRNLWIKT
jgi:hypothetical protein